MSNGGRRGLIELLLLAAGAVLFLALGAPAALARWHERRKQIRQLEQSNAALAKEIQARRERLRQLGSSPSRQELHIRQQQKRVRKGETLFILPEPPKP